jgi:AraC-like DNA-binding protein
MMQPCAPLDRFPVVSTRSIKEAEDALGRILTKASIKIEDRAERFHALLRSYCSQHIRMSYNHYGAAVCVDVPPTDVFSQVFPIAGVRITEIDGKRVTMAADANTGMVISPGIHLKAMLGVDYEQLALRIQPKPLIQKLAAIIGEPISAPLQIELVQDMGMPAARSLRDQLLFIVSEVNRAETPPPLVIAEWEQALMVAFLCGNRHNYSHRLARKTHDLAPWQVRRAEEYIESHWNQQIWIEDIAMVTGVSARNLFRTFRQSRGCSPMAFAKRIRLSHSRRLLQSAAPTSTVTDVAFACGFSDLGRFSREYRQAFGELPSEALKRSRSTGN